MAKPLMSWVSKESEPAGKQIQDRNPQHPQAGHRQAHHGPAVEGHFQRAALSFLVRHPGSPDVRLRGRLHAHKPGGHRTTRTQQEAQRRHKRDLPRQQQEHHPDEHGQIRVLRLQECHRAGVDHLGDLAHLVVAGILRLDVAVELTREHEADNRHDQHGHQPNPVHPPGPTELRKRFHATFLLCSVVSRLAHVRFHVGKPIPQPLLPASPLPPLPESGY